MNKLETISLKEVVDMVNEKTLKALGRKAIYKYDVNKNGKIRLYMSKPEEVRMYGNKTLCIEALNQCFLLKLKKNELDKKVLIKNIEEQRLDLEKLKEELRQIASMRNPNFNKSNKIKSIVQKYKGIIKKSSAENINYLLAEIKYFTNLDEHLKDDVKEEIKKIRRTNY